MTADARRGTQRAADHSDAPIAFASKRDGNWEIYVMDPAGQSVRVTRRDSSEDRFPMWSPDRTRIAFGSTTGRSGDGWDLWVVDADGGNARRLYPGIVAKSLRAWSRDSRRIVITAVADGNLDIAIVDVDSGRAARLTRGAAEDRDPCWSPDGQHIAFSSTRDGNSEIYVMRVDGTGVLRLTTDPAFDGTPAWSSDGTRIAFVSTRGGVSDVYTIQPNGDGLERLTMNARVTKDPSRWSPDGALLAVQIARGDNYDIAVVNVRDREHIDVAASPAYDGMFTWSPDGAALAFVSGRDGYDALYRMDADGGNVRRLTDTPTLNPAWPPGR